MRGGKSAGSFRITTKLFRLAHEFAIYDIEFRCKGRVECVTKWVPTVAMVSMSVFEQYILVDQGHTEHVEGYSKLIYNNSEVGGIFPDPKIDGDGSFVDREAVEILNIRQRCLIHISIE